MSFLTALKTVSNKINSIAKAMDDKVENFAEQVLAIVTEYDSDFFANAKDSEKDRADMKASIIKLFDMFQPEDKKPKNINGYILFTKENREDCTKRNLGLSPTEITKALSVEWKALDQEERDAYNTRAKSVAPKSEEEKKAKKASSVKASKSDKVVKKSPVSKVSDKKKSPSDAKDSVKEKLAVAEKKVALAKLGAVKNSDEAKEEKFSLKKTVPVLITEKPEWWVCKGVKIEGEKHRLHKETGFVLHLTENKLIGSLVDGKFTKVDEMYQEQIMWVKQCGISVDKEEDIELDEELSSEDEM